MIMFCLSTPLLAPWNSPEEQRQLGTFLRYVSEVPSSPGSGTDAELNSLRRRDAVQVPGRCASSASEFFAVDYDNATWS